MSDLDRSVHRSLWVLVTHSSFIVGLHTTKNTASGYKVAVAHREIWKDRDIFVNIALMSDFKLAFKLALNIAYLGPVL